MTRRVVRLVERRSRRVRLPAAEVSFLRRHAAPLIDVTPTFRRGVYRLTPRSMVGHVVGPAVRYEVAPKLPWPAVLRLLGITAPAADPSPPPPDLLPLLVNEFVARLTAATAAGLVLGYSERDAESPFLTGRLRVADHMRAAAAWAFPDQFAVTTSHFGADTPWHRIAVAVGRSLPSTASLIQALAPLAGVPPSIMSDQEFVQADADPRAEAYRPLMSLCRTIRDGLAGFAPDGRPGDAFLLDLARLFERYVLSSVSGHLPGRVREQPRLTLAPGIDLQPDAVVTAAGGGVRAVVDAKWKRFGPTPDADDLHQILAYAGVTGARRAVLVYPGTRPGVQRFGLPRGGVEVVRLRLQLCGDPVGCDRSVGRLARVSRGNHRP